MRGMVLHHLDAGTGAKNENKLNSFSPIRIAREPFRKIKKARGRLTVFGRRLIRYALTYYEVSVVRAPVRGSRGRRSTRQQL